MLFYTGLLWSRGITSVEPTKASSSCRSAPLLRNKLRKKLAELHIRRRYILLLMWIFGLVYQLVKEYAQHFLFCWSQIGYFYYKGSLFIYYLPSPLACMSVMPSLCQELNYLHAKLHWNLCSCLLLKALQTDRVHLEFITIGVE